MLERWGFSDRSELAFHGYAKSARTDRVEEHFFLTMRKHGRQAYRVGAMSLDTSRHLTLLSVLCHSDGETQASISSCLLGLLSQTLALARQEVSEKMGLCGLWLCRNSKVLHNPCPGSRRTWPVSTGASARCADFVPRPSLPKEGFRGHPGSHAGQRSYRVTLPNR